ncbi:MAG: sensor histidine kinase, partial [Actinomycetota bacterium]|nr:sensor histidine kinase [Actinomycetota bacterium]
DVRLTHRSLDRQYEERARAVAAVVANMAEVRTALQAGDPQHVIQPLASRLAASAGAAYVVVTDRTGRRYSHPNPALIGQRLEEPVAVLDGQDHVGIDNGSLGRSANGKAPIFAADGQVIGQVSVGILETSVTTELNRQIAAIVAYSGLVLALGIGVSVLLSRAIRRLTFGLELREIASLLQEREAMLHGIREGVIGFDARSRVSLLNDEARRLLDIGTAGVGEPLDDLVPPGRLRDVLSGQVPGGDRSVMTNDALLVVNRRPVTVAGRDVGSIVTLRDRTELEALVRRMNAVTGLSNALRAQEHEFTNRLHVIAGLLDLGENDEARSYLDLIVEQNAVTSEDLRARVSPPVVAALLLAKIAVGAERGVTVSVAEGSSLHATEVDANLLMSVIGNLVDNAIDATAGQPEPREVTVKLSEMPGELQIQVDDTGPGVSANAVKDIFTDGYSTKPARSGLHRGVGLALVRRLLARHHGQVEARPGPGGHFQVRLPLSGVGLDAGLSEGDHQSSLLVDKRAGP